MKQIQRIVNEINQNIRQFLCRIHSVDESTQKLYEKKNWKKNKIIFVLTRAIVNNEFFSFSEKIQKWFAVHKYQV